MTTVTSELPVAEESSARYVSLEERSRTSAPSLALAVTCGALAGVGATYCVGFGADRSAEDGGLVRVLPMLTVPPAPCSGWVTRCRRGATTAASQGYARYWPEPLCFEGAKLSCTSRTSAWASATLALEPTPASSAPERVTDSLAHPTLFVFLPGTGTRTGKVPPLLSYIIKDTSEPPNLILALALTLNLAVTTPSAWLSTYPTRPLAQVRALLSSAADMGLHAIGLSYASLPIAVSMMNLWCTRPGALPSTCNAEMHESVLWGSPSSTNGAGGVWDVPANQSVASLLAYALRSLEWEAFLDSDGRGGIRWDRVVVSGHSQGASHAAYLSTVVRVRAAVLLSGPQEAPECAGWLSSGPPTLRRAVYALKEECGDEPEARDSWCATAHPKLLQANLEAMGLRRGYLGNHSGYVVDTLPAACPRSRPHPQSP